VSQNNVGFDEDAIRAQFPDEVVTKALLRDVRLPGSAGKGSAGKSSAGTMALITLDNGFDHTKPNSHGPGGLLELRHALDAVAARDDIVAVGITGKPFIFAVGADLKGAGRIASREQGLDVMRLCHDVYRRLGELDVPTFAFVNGVALGGGLEVALHCTYRTISGDPRADVGAVAFPECFLGLLPGAGGTYLLPRLIGPGPALKVIIENALSQNRMLKAPDALGLGIADVMFEPADFLVQSLRWAGSVLTGEFQVPRKPLASAEDWSAATQSARFFADGKVHGAAPAPYRAISLVEAARDRSRDEGFAAEDEAMADLFISPEFKASLYAFDLTQKRARSAVGAPDASLARPVTKVGIVGAGLMAAQIALLFARRLEVPVVLTDVDQARLDAGVAHVHDEFARLRDRGRLSADAAARLTALVSGSLAKDAFADADFVIEAVFEEMKVKQQVFAEVEAVVRPDCVLATNTSSLSVSEMASGLGEPSRLVGFHFFNPVAMMPLVEVVRTGSTSDEAVATALAVGKKLKKNCVLVKDAPAFVVNRLLTRFLGEITSAVDEGTPFEVAEHALDRLGLPMPPFLLLQLVGPAVALHVAETLHEAFPARFAVSPKLSAMVAAGLTAVYRPDFSVDPAVADLLSGGSAGSATSGGSAGSATSGGSAGSAGSAGRPSTGEQVLARALAGLAQEIRIMLDDGVVAAPEDIDLCMILGAGWPFHLGGITPYLDSGGISAQVTGTTFR
jgi:3-hydroxyacyl-CoA dehydrogenase/enoyl-CoA hydratase/carnithine racemase